ncbi:uncharacterized protein BXIN_2032 [Babesia sp. Xinjiang]|uniref:uncharacterized protein n=1 Tax=Babesia sp. Xinjiang TaxID=462227 RepID=UPI000A231482|nr:uncharacterized protein BXIN_2032 [Babesia sp. Xinjiang]ORM40332.1 hypothetical protein BXIN_2032 [Babesia sp. Xinjiang]
MAGVRRITGAKLLITKANLHAQKKDSVCGGYTSVADLPCLLETSERPAHVPTYSYITASLVLFFISRDTLEVTDLHNSEYETFLAGDPSGCVRVKFPANISPPETLEGNTYIVIDVAIVVSRGKLHLEVIEGTRLLPYNGDARLHVLRGNDVSRNVLCEVTNKERIERTPLLQ